MDGEVYAKSESYHAQLLAQAAEKTEKRREIIGKDLDALLDELRAFRHRERTSYRLVLKEDLVNKNLQLLKKAFPLFESEMVSFIEDLEHKPRTDEESTPTCGI